jgi:GxxExxY protein
MTENAIAKQIADAAVRLHTTLGPGLLESVYDTVLAYELGRRGLRTVRQQPIPVVYEGVRIDTGFRADLVVEDKVIVEVKSVEILAPVHKKQLLTYLRLADKRLGLLINFHVALIKDGITRVVNGLEDDPSRKVAKPQRRVETRQPLLGISRAEPLVMLRQEPFAVTLHVRICAGGGQQWPSLPRPSSTWRRCAAERRADRSGDDCVTRCSR